MIRTQLYLDEQVHARLHSLAHKQGRTLSEVVRDILSRALGGVSDDERRKTLDAIEGLWGDRSDIPATDAYVRQLRHDTRGGQRRKS